MASAMPAPVPVRNSKSGLRCPAAASIFWADRTKAGKRRVAALPPCRSRVGYVAALRGAPCSFRTTDGPTPIAVARMMARLKRLVRRIRRAGLDPKLTPHDLRHTSASWHYALNATCSRSSRKGAGRVSRWSRGTRTYCRPAMMRRSLGFSADARRAPIRRRPRQGLDTQRRFLQRYTLHTGGITGSIPVAPTSRERLRQARSSVAEHSHHMGEVRGSIPLRAYHPVDEESLSAA